MANVSGVPGFNPNPQQSASTANAKELMESAVSLIRGMIDTSDEGATRGALMRSGKNRDGKIGNQAAFENVPTKRGDYIPLAAEAMAGATEASEQEEDLRLKKKNKELRQKLETLLSQLEDADLQGLTPQEQETVKQFIKNAKTIVTMQRELSYLDQKEQKLQEIVDKQKKAGQ